MRPGGESRLERDRDPAGRSSEVVIVEHADRTTETRAPRIEVMLVMGIESDSNFYAGFTENLSECGVFVATRTTLEVGSTVDISITLPEQPPIRARGTVRWLRPYTEWSDLPAGMGVRFDQLSSRDAARIHAFSEARAPIFFDDEAVSAPISVR